MNKKDARNFSGKRLVEQQNLMNALNAKKENNKMKTTKKSSSSRRQSAYKAGDANAIVTSLINARSQNMTAECMSGDHEHCSGDPAGYDCDCICHLNEEQQAEYRLVDAKAKAPKGDTPMYRVQLPEFAETCFDCGRQLDARCVDNPFGCWSIPVFDGNFKQTFCTYCHNMRNGVGDAQTYLPKSCKSRDDLNRWLAVEMNKRFKTVELQREVTTADGHKMTLVHEDDAQQLSTEASCIKHLQEAIDRIDIMIENVEFKRGAAVKYHRLQSLRNSAYTALRLAIEINKK